MSWHFNPGKATQAAAYLLKLGNADRMNYLKVLKLLYLADRLSIREKGYPVTGDDVYAMDYGPVLTRVYDFIRARPRLGADVWAESFRTDNYDLVLLSDPKIGDLSRHDIRILNKVFEEHHDVNGFDVSELTHDFPEWQQHYRRDTSTLIPLDAILQSLDFSPADREKILQEAESDKRYFAFFEQLSSA